ncbi:MAG UNVERIFIED_CONTAM: hypothetical protein MIJ72_11520 [Staphylococcus saprophyticus]
MTFETVPESVPPCFFLQGSNKNHPGNIWAKRANCATNAQEVQIERQEEEEEEEEGQEHEMNVIPSSSLPTLMRLLLLHTMRKPTFLHESTNNHQSLRQQGEEYCCIDKRSRRPSTWEQNTLHPTPCRQSMTCLTIAMGHVR